MSIPSGNCCCRRWLRRAAVAEPDHVAALVHGDADADRVLPLDAHARRRRVGEAAFDGGDVAEPEQAPAGLDADFAECCDRFEVTRDANPHAVGRRLVEAGRGHRILLLQRVEDEPAG
jgi:hypothetical protein